MWSTTTVKYLNLTLAGEGTRKVSVYSEAIDAIEESEEAGATVHLRGGSILAVDESRKTILKALVDQG